MMCWNFLFYKIFNLIIGNLPVKGGAQREHFPFFILFFFFFFEFNSRAIKPGIKGPKGSLWGPFFNGLVYYIDNCD